MGVISLSGLAALLLYEDLQASGADATSTFRLTRTEDGFALVHDSQCDEDCVAVFRNQVVLAIDPSLKEMLGPCRLDGRVDADCAEVVLCKAGRNEDGEEAEVIWQCSCRG